MNELDLRTILVVALGQFAPWLAVVVVVSLVGYPGVVCVTPMAWLIATRVGLVCVGRSRSSGKGARLAEAALAGALLGVLQGLLFGLVIPRMGPILPNEEAGAIGLVVGMAVVGIVVGAFLALFTGYMAERRRG